MENAADQDTQDRRLPISPFDGRQKKFPDFAPEIEIA